PGAGDCAPSPDEVIVQAGLNGQIRWSKDPATGQDQVTIVVDRARSLQIQAPIAVREGLGTQSGAAQSQAAGLGQAVEGHGVADKTVDVVPDDGVIGWARDAVWTPVGSHLPAPAVEIGPTEGVGDAWRGSKGRQRQTVGTD